MAQICQVKASGATARWNQMFSAMAVAARPRRETEKRCAVTNVGEDLRRKAPRTRKGADKQALTLSSRCSHSLDLCYIPTYDVVWGTPPLSRRESGYARLLMTIHVDNTVLYYLCYDASLGKSVCSALAQQMFLQRFLSIDFFVAEYRYRKK